MAVKKYSYKKQGNKSLSKHFKVKEFVSNVNGKVRYDEIKVDSTLITKLEKMFNYGVDSIAITSGYRAPRDSIAVGGYSNDAHTRGIAADIICYKRGKALPVSYVACLAQIVGFSGIGIMSGSVHVDVRNRKNYLNSHWWGDERNGENYIKDYFNYTHITRAELFGKLEYYKEECYVIKALKKTPIRYKPEANGKIKKYYAKGKVARIFAVVGKFGKVLSGWVYLPDTKKYN